MERGLAARHVAAVNYGGDRIGGVLDGDGFGFGGHVARTREAREGGEEFTL